MVFVVVLRLLIANIARFPVVSFTNNVRLDILFSQFLFALVLRKRIIQIMLSFWIVRLRLIRVEALSNFFYLACVVCMAA